MVSKKKKIRVAGCTCAYFNTIETQKHVFLKKTFANTTIVLQVSTIISFYQLCPAYQFGPLHGIHINIKNGYKKQTQLLVSSEDFKISTEFLGES